MESKHSIYQAPSADLSLQPTLPESFTNGQLTAGSIKIALGLTILNIILELVALALGVVTGIWGSESNRSLLDTSGNLLTLLTTGIGIYLLLFIKKFIRKCGNPRHSCRGWIARTRKCP